MMTEPMPDKYFTTERELEFIKSLSRNKLALEGYLKAADKRVAWGFIRKSEVVRYAQVLLGALI
jgi:hypothetical protein